MSVAISPCSFLAFQIELLKELRDPSPKATKKALPLATLSSRCLGKLLQLHAPIFRYFREDKHSIINSIIEAARLPEFTPVPRRATFLPNLLAHQ